MKRAKTRAAIIVAPIIHLLACVMVAQINKNKHIQRPTVYTTTAAEFINQLYGLRWGVGYMINNFIASPSQPWVEWLFWRFVEMEFQPLSVENGDEITAKRIYTRVGF